ncbi:ThiF family adenylyltransferase [Cellulomonas timonensis]|uniref:ThiF family adenylyltransferase n=1 Tax=Cellulomonas timonensis TaxID=1689271 RepID=UPI000833B277|nr:ThiF family adenylyltransferase [Cellulomonas timonensis]
MRLRPGLRVLRRGPSEVQVGADPRWAVRLVDLGAREVDLLLELEHGGDLDLLRREAGRHGVSAARAGELADALRSAQVTSDGPRRAGPPLRPGASAEVEAWTLLRDDGDGAAQVRARAGRSVGVVGLGRTGLGAALTLAASGVGTILLDDDSWVTSLDVGASGYRVSDVGGRRLSAAARALRDIAPEVEVSLPPGQRPDVILHVERGAADPATAVALVASGATHLSVVLREADASVGPFVVPGEGPCLRCLDLHRADVDAAWPTVAAQLVAARPRGPPPPGEPGEPGVLAGVCAALAAAEVLAHLDGRTPRTRGATVEVAMPDVLPQTRGWEVHPQCGCTSLPPAPAVPPAVPPAPASARGPAAGRW